MLETEIAELRHTVEELQGRIDVFQAALDSHATTASAVEPWVGPEGQLRLRLERAEQVLLALIDPNVIDFTAAQERARTILTAIPPA